MSRTALRRAIPCLLCALAPAQSPPPDAAPSWPPLPQAQRERLDQLCTSLRRAVKPEQVERAEAELIALGAAAAPLLIDKLSDYRQNINASLAKALDAVTAREHAPLLAASAGDRRAAVRAWVLRRLTAFHAAELAPVFRAARRDRDSDIAFQAALGLASAGELEAMDAIFERCRTDWRDLREPVTTALRGVRGTAGTRWILERMRDGDERALVTGLRLLRAVAVPESAVLIAPYLDHESHAVKKDAINALRAAVDGDAPDEELSVFQVIEQANAWKKRL